MCSSCMLLCDKNIKYYFIFRVNSLSKSFEFWFLEKRFYLNHMDVSMELKKVTISVHAEVYMWLKHCLKMFHNSTHYLS